MSMVSSDEEEEHTVWNLFPGSCGAKSGMRAESCLEDEELARTALSCHLSTDLLCPEMSDAW